MGLEILIGLGAVLAIAVVSVLVMIAYRRVVPTNMVHIVQSSKKTTSYGKGKESGNTYYEFPASIPVIGVKVTEFPESIFQVSLQDYEAYDSARLPFKVDISAFFRVDSAETAAQRVASFNELLGQLQDLLRGSVRRILATAQLEEIMQERSSYGQQFTDEVKNQIKEWGVLPVKTIEFMDIRDANGSRVIADIMAKEQSRIQTESRVKVAENNREAEEKEIEAQRQVELQKQDALKQVGLRTAEKDREVGIANEQAQQEIQTQAKITAERNMEVVRVESVKKAEIEKDVAQVKAEQDRKVAEVKAQQDKTVQITAAEAQKESATRIADAELYAASKNAEGIRVEGEAKAKAEEAMLMAPVTTQIALANEIGSNEGYQTYLITIKQVEASQEVGKELAKAMANADMKIIANSGDMQSGMTSLGDMFTSKGGMNLSAMMEAMSTTDAGKALVSKVTGLVEDVTGTTEKQGSKALGRLKKPNEA